MVSKFPKGLYIKKARKSIYNTNGKWATNDLSWRVGYAGITKQQIDAVKRHKSMLSVGPSQSQIRSYYYKLLTSYNEDYVLQMVGKEM